MFVLNTLAPVFLLIGAGAWLQRSGFVSVGFLKETNRLTYWLALPALMFTQLATSFHGAGGAKLMLTVMVGATLLVIALGYLLAWVLRIPGAAVGTFVQGAFRGNLAFVGLPIVYAMPEVTLPGGMSARAAAFVVVGPMMVGYNFAAVVVLLLSRHKLGWAMARPFLRQLLATPLLLATAGGIGFALAGWTLPGPVDKALGALGAMALPLGLLSVGGSLMTLGSSVGGRAAWTAALVKTVGSPLIGWGVGRALGLGAVELKMTMIFMAAPAAIASYAMAVELKGDEALASGAIVLGVLTSIGSLAVILAVF